MGKTEYMKVNSKKYTRVCVPCSMYCLTYYLLMSSMEEIKHTFFFMAPTIPQSLREKFKEDSAYIDLNNKWVYKNRFAVSLYMLIKRKLSWPFLFDAEIFGLDFYWYLLRGLKFNYIEDAPFVFDIWETSSLYANWNRARHANILKRLAKRFLFGEYYDNYVGTSTGVEHIYSSNPVAEKPYYKGKEITVLNLNEIWEKSDKSKKDFILSVYEISDADLLKMKTCNTIILTQPMCFDKIMTMDEQIEIYRQMIDEYGAENCIIKPHPRDVIKYNEVFPNVAYFNKPVPMQLLAILGINYENVVTVNSSSALSFGKDANIYWWAEKLDYPRITDSGAKTLREAKEMFR